MAKKDIEVGSYVFKGGKPPQLIVTKVTKEKVTAIYTDPRTNKVTTYEGAPSAFKIAEG